MAASSFGGSPGCRTLVFGNVLVAILPESVDGGFAPTGTVARCTNGLIRDEHIHRVGVELGKMPKRDPAAFFDRNLKFEIVLLSVSRHFFRRDDLSVG